MSNIKMCFESRFTGGRLIQFDYSQLEVVCLAYLAQDPQLRNDLLRGVDMHCRMASFLTGQSYEYIKDQVDSGSSTWIAKRKEAKALGFLIQYGGSANLMHTNTGIDKVKCKAFIKAYYTRYKRVNSWQNSIAKRVEDNRTPSDKLTAGGHQLGISTINSVTGRRYTFIEQLSPAWKARSTSFSPTQMKNYPVQGLATGDIVPMMLGRWNRWLQEFWPDHAKLVNTTHDSGMLDVDVVNLGEGSVTTLITDSRRLLESAPIVFEEIFGKEFDMPLKVDVEWGRDWGALEVFPRT